ncbi:MAG: hypothetical protein ACRDFW_09160 [bacterium]
MSNIFVENREHASLLVIVFNSSYPHSVERPFEFFDLTSALQCSRIHCKDPAFVFYHGGIDQQHRGIRAMASRLQQHIADLSPRVTIALGASSGGYAAVVFGHLCGFDHVHGLGTVTCLLPEFMREHAREDTPLRWVRYQKLWNLPEADWALFDLVHVLAKHNGRTKYYLHFCADNARDRSMSERLAKSPGVTLLPYPCNHHYVTVYMHKNNLLGRLFGLPPIRER